MTAGHEAVHGRPAGERAPSEEIRARKAALRARMRELLARVTPEQRHAASAEAAARLVRLPQFHAAQTVMLYVPLASELDATPLALRCFQEGKTTGVPRIDSTRHEMWPVEATSFEDHAMELDAYGVRTPKDGRPIPPETIDLVVVPGLAFDEAGRRLGRGGGFYDRFLARLSRDAIFVGYGFDGQVVPEVPADERDVRMHLVVTERRGGGGSRDAGAGSPESGIRNQDGDAARF